MSFENLNLIQPILKALKKEEYISPTPIQSQAIPHLLNKKDLLGLAQTGTGKTAAFAIPLIQMLSLEENIDYKRRKIRALILTPTRELAVQIGESFETYGCFTNLKYKVIFGGVSQHHQVEALQTGIDVLVATPGRLLDLINQKYISLSNIQYFVLDEADRMLDMGFINDVKKVITKLPSKRQTLFFSATMPDEVVDLSNKILNNPIRVEVTPVSSTVDIIKQSVYFVDKGNKRHLLIEVLKDKDIERALVFTRTKHGADKIAKELTINGIHAQAIHGNKSQNARQLALKNFKSKVTRVLVATDIAARGIDIDELSHVINFELPNIAESYVHRIGRTGRAGTKGTAISFCDAEEKAYLKDIQKLIGKEIPEIENSKYPLMIHQIVKEKAKLPTPQKKKILHPEKAKNEALKEKKKNEESSPKAKSKKKHWFPRKGKQGR